MSKKVQGLILVMVMSITLTTGCSSISILSRNKDKDVTVLSIAKSAQSAIDEVESYEGEIIVDLDLEYEIAGADVLLKYDKNLSQEVILDNYLEHSSGNIESLISYKESDGGSSIEGIETYATKEDGFIYTYNSTDNSGWTYNSTSNDYNMAEILYDLFNVIEENEEEFELDKSAYKLNDREVNVVSGEVEVNELQDILTAPNSESYMTGINEYMDSEVAQIEICFYAHSDLPARITIDLAKAYESYAGENIDNLRFDSVKVNDLSLRFEFIDFDCVDDLSIPDKIIDSAVKEPDKGDDSTGYDSSPSGYDTSGQNYDDYIPEDGVVAYGNYSVNVGDISGFTFNSANSSKHFGYYDSTDEDKSDSVRVTIVYTGKDASEYINSEMEYYINSKGNALCSEIKTVTIGDYSGCYQTIVYDNVDRRDEEVYICVNLEGGLSFVVKRSICGEELDDAKLTEFVNEVCSGVVITKE